MTFFRRYLIRDADWVSTQPVIDGADMSKPPKAYAQTKKAVRSSVEERPVKRQATNTTIYFPDIETYVLLHAIETFRYLKWFPGAGTPKPSKSAIVFDLIERARPEFEAEMGEYLETMRSVFGLPAKAPQKPNVKDAPQPKARKTRGSTLPEDWQPDLTLLAEVVAEGLPPHRIPTCIARFREHYLILKPGQLRRNWDLVFKKWCSNDVRFHEARS